MPAADAGSFEIELGDWARLRDVATPIRTTVFVDEQQVPPELEIDEWDERCVHAIARAPDGTPVGTGRLLPDGHIGRMAVLSPWRGTGAGSRLLLALIDAARARGDREVALNAQMHAVPFYRRHGFVEEGEPFDDAGIEHIAMRRRL